MSRGSKAAAVMDYRRFGATGVKVSPICLGSAFRGRPGDDVCKAIIAQAIDLGINFIDVANIYQEGHSERLVGEVLKGRRDQFVLTTKVGSSMGIGPNDTGLSRAHILREIEHSLRRLQTDHIDIYLVHQLDPTTPHQETLRALDDLVHQGKVRYIGCCNYTAWQVCAALWTSDRAGLTPFIGVQNHYNLLRRSPERELLPFCREQGLGVMTYSPLAVGLLSGRFRRDTPPPSDTLWGQRRSGFQDAMTPAADRVIATLIRLAQERGKTPAQVAIAWILSHPEISAAMIGPDRPEHVTETVGAATWKLDPVARTELDAVSAWALNGTHSA